MGGCLSLSFFLHQHGEQIPQAKMLVLVAAIQTPCLWFTHTGTTVAVICPVSHLLLVATHMVGVHQVSYQLSHGSGSFPPTVDATTLHVEVGEAAFIQNFMVTI